MKKLLLVSLICVLVFSLAITAMAKVKVVFWTYPSMKVEGLEPGEYEQKVVDQFEEEYPEIEVDFQIFPYSTEGYQKVNFAIASGDPPDIFAQTTMAIGGWACAGLLVPFDLTEEEKNDFLPVAIEAVTFDGKIYGYPIGAHIACLTISRKWAREAGALHLAPFDRPDRHWTVDEFKAYVKAVVDAKLDRIVGMTMWFGCSTAQQNWIMLMVQSFGAKLFVVEDGKYRCVINSPEAIRGVEYFLDIHKSIPGFFPDEIATLTPFKQAGLFKGCALSIGMVRVILQGLAGNEELVEIDFGLVPYPSIEGVPNATLWDWHAFAVFDNGDEEKAKAAQLFVRYFIDNAPKLNEANYFSFPPKKSLPYPAQEFMDNPEVQYHFNELVKLSIDYGTKSPVYTQFKEAFRIAMSGVFTGELTAKEGLDEVADKMNKLLDEFYAKKVK